MSAEYPVMSATQLSASEHPEHSTLPPAGSDVFGQYGAAVTCASAVILMMVIGTIDKLTGYELQLLILYLIPVALVTWSAGRTWGLVMAAVAIIVWMVTFRTHQPSVSDSLHFYWDGAVSLATLTVFAILIDRLHATLERANERLVKVLEELDIATYVVDQQKQAVLYGNRRFRETLEGRPYEALNLLGGKECEIYWPDGRPVMLRLVTEQAQSQAQAN
jgi:K+-sensing histidine kinase KdpD